MTVETLCRIYMRKNVCVCVCACVCVRACAHKRRKGDETTVTLVGLLIGISACAET